MLVVVLLVTVVVEVVVVVIVVHIVEDGLVVKAADVVVGEAVFPIAKPTNIYMFLRKHFIPFIPSKLKISISIE